ncbi:MAG: hypothetical protein WDN27_03745 [Candidatus Saccharibacteria bacterium]
MTITTAGTTIQNKQINGCVDVEAPNVTIKNSRIICNDTALFIGDGSTSGFLIQDSEVSCNGHHGTGIGPQNYTALRVNVSACENGFWAEHNSTIQDSYISRPHRL